MRRRRDGLVLGLGAGSRPRDEVLAPQPPPVIRFLQGRVATHCQQATGADDALHTATTTTPTTPTAQCMRTAQTTRAHHTHTQPPSPQFMCTHALGELDAGSDVRSRSHGTQQTGVHTMPGTAAPKQSVPHSGGVGGGAANDGRRWGSRARRARSRACGGCGAIRGCLGGARWQWRGTLSGYRPTRHFTPTSAWRRARPGQWRGNRRRWLSEMGCGSAHELHGTATTTWVRCKDVQRFPRWFGPSHAYTCTHGRQHTHVLHNLYIHGAQCTWRVR